MKRLAVALAAIFALAVLEPTPLQAQAVAPKAPLAFEVATIKPEDPAKSLPSELRIYPGGRLVIHGHELRGLIHEAFNLTTGRVLGGEKWVDTLRFDIEAKPPEELRDSVPGGEYAWFGIQDPQERTMLQALLVQRFHLKYHMETQPATVCLLQRGTGPLRLQQVEPDLYTRAEDGTVSPSASPPTGMLSVVGGSPVSFTNTSMARLAKALHCNSQGAPVIDQTGLPGFYNFKSARVVTDDDFKSGEFADLLTEALPEMGLKLTKAPGKIENLVIDSAELPTQN